MNAYCLLLIMIASTYGVDVTLRSYSSKIAMPIPPPPSCDRRQNDLKHRIVPVEIHFLDTSVPIFEGSILWSSIVTARCVTNFFGSKDQTIIETVSNPLPINTAQQYTLASGPVDTISDLTSAPIFKCSWFKTEIHKTVRIYQKRVMGYPSVYEGFIAGDVAWSPISNTSYYRHEHRLLVRQRELAEACPLTLQSIEKGILSSGPRDTYFVSVPTRELFFSFDPHVELSICPENPTPLYHTNLGFILGLNMSENSHLVDVRAQKSEFLSFSTNLVESQIGFDLFSLSKDLARDMHLIQKQLCMQQRARWRKIMSDNDLESMAVYATGDPFAHGFMDKDIFYVQILLPSIILVPVSDIVLTLPNKLVVLYKGEIYPVEPISGILSPMVDRFRIAPPILPLENGSFINIASHLVVEEHYKYYEATILAPLRTGSHVRDHFHHFSDQTKEVPKRTIYTSFLETVSGFLPSWSGWTSTILACLVGFCLIYFGLNAFCRRLCNQPQYAASIPRVQVDLRRSP